MAYGGQPVSPGHDTRDFVLGTLVSLVAMVAVVLAVLFYVGALSSQPEIAAAEPRRIVVSSDDLKAEAKPTAVWRFRSEWLTPAAERDGR